MTQVGLELVTDVRLMLTLPIVNLPEGSKRIRVRQRQDFPVPLFYVQTADGLLKCVAALIADGTAIELQELAGNFTRYD